MIYNNRLKTCLVAAAVTLLSISANAAPARSVRSNFSSGNGSNGYKYWIALKANGTVDAFGENGGFELGIGNNLFVSAPVGVLKEVGDPLVDIIEVSSGEGHSLALHVDGTVYAWGNNVWGQTGDGTKGNVYTGIENYSEFAAPVQTSSGVYLNSIVAVSGGTAFSMALRADGTVWAWGNDEEDQLGNGPHPSGTSSSSAYAVPVLDVSGTLTNVVAISAGGGHGLALKADGSVWSWGGGTGSTKAVQVKCETALPGQPSQPVMMSNIIGISAENGASYALEANGKVWSWGDNYNLALGSGETDNFFQTGTLLATPVRQKVGSVISDLDDITFISPGLAIKSNGTVFEWGIYANSAYAKQVIKTSSPAGPLDDIVTVEGNLSIRYAVTSNGSVWEWANPTGPSSFLPLSLSWSRPRESVIASDYHALSLLEDGTINGYGRNGIGQLGNGTTSPLEGVHPNVSPITTVVNADQTIFDQAVAISSSGGFSLALRSDGTVWAWGDNTYGQLGTGVSAGGYSTTPVQVLGAGGVLLDRVVSIAAGIHHSLAVRSDGSVVSWGRNHYGQLGNNDFTHTDSAAFVTVSGLQNVVTVSAGQQHSLARKADGTVFAWGDNTIGQLGRGNYTSSDVPVQSLAMPGMIKSITTGWDHSLAITATGGVLGWGSNSHAQVGASTIAHTPTVVAVSYIIQVTAGRYTSMSVGPDHPGSGGRGWGGNSSWIISSGTFPPPRRTVATSPTPLLKSSKVVSLDCGQIHAIYRRSDGMACLRDAYYYPDNPNNDDEVIAGF